MRPLVGVGWACILSMGIVVGAQSPSSRPADAGQAASATSTSAEQLLASARAYNEGTNGPPRFTKAFQLFEQASAAGSMEAKAWLGSMYLRGRGTPRNVALALPLIQAAAASNDPVGLRFMGAMYQNGLGVQQDYSRARSYYQKAITQNDGNSLGRLGLMYLLGLGMKPDRSRAIQLLTQGANAGDIWSKVEIARFYEGSQAAQEDGADALPASFANPNYALALKYYSEAAASGNRLASFSLGRMYESGKGVRQDYEQAFGYYQAAASRGLPDGLLAVGRFYERGLRSGAANYVYAYVFYRSAADQGDLGAEQRLQSLSLQMTPQQRQEAESLLQRLGRQ